MSQSRFFHISVDKGLTVERTFQEALDAAKSGGYVWFDYDSPTREELTLLIDPLGLHPLSIEDATDTNQVPKMDDYPGNTFFIFNAFAVSDGGLSITEFDLFIGESFLVTVSRCAPEVENPSRHMDDVIRNEIEHVTEGPAFLMHVILDRIVDRMFSAVESLEDELDTAEELVLSDPEHFDPENMLALRRNLIDLRKSLFHEREILIKITRKDCPYIPDKAVFHFRDIYDHLEKFFELTEDYRDILSSLMELYASMINNLMARTANETNATVRRLTFITTIFMPLTLLTGIGGMSEWSMMTGPQNWRVTYPLFVLGMAVIGVVTYHLLKRINR